MSHNHPAAARCQADVHRRPLDSGARRQRGLELTALGRRASVGWLVRELEGEGEVVACEGDAPCPLRGACRLRRALRDAQEAFHATLNPLTVADLVASPAGPVLVGLSGRRTG
ncbi:UNVERIFIED_CONTAM: Rrf2 family nitric oxide-sensitive transcriptional repressor [Streptomyces graminofaciens]